MKAQLIFQRGWPLAWPEGRPRAPEPSPALFRHQGGPVDRPHAEKRLLQQLSAMTQVGHPWRTDNIVLSTAVRFTLDGRIDQSRRDPDDQGVALYFDLDRRPYVLACDRWNRRADNIAAIAAHIEALRGQERWGVADLAQAFAGHVALPPPEGWWQVLELPRSASLADIEVAFRRLAPKAHPDSGGSHAAMSRLNAARAAGRKEKS